MNIYAVILDGVVIQRAAWDGSTPWTPPLGAIAVLLEVNEECSEGYLYNAQTSPRFTAPPEE